MKRREFHRLALAAPLPLLCAFLWACAGAGGPAAPGGGPGGAAVGENLAAGSVAAPEAAFNPGSIQAGGEGHGQEGRQASNVATVKTKDGRGNCGALPGDLQAHFEGDAVQPMLMSWVSGAELGPFGAFQEKSMGSFGRTALPQCPLMVTVQGEQFQATMRARFLKLMATYTDPSGKFFQSEPMVMPCPPVCVGQTCPAICAAPPCDTCLQLKDETEIAEADRVRGETAPPSPVDFVPPSLPSIEDRDLANPRLRVIEGPGLLPNLSEDFQFRR